VNRTRLGVLVSGSGTNLQALLDACAAKDFPAEVSVVLSNVGEAFALERAQRANVPSVVLDPRDYPTRAQYDLSLVAALQANGVELVCLAGFMRLLGPDFLRAFPGRVLNIHPALLPAFPGLHGPRQAIAHGVKIAGCTVHLVDEGLDSGPILAQAAVPVLPDDDEQTLAARILEQEHRLYPLAVRALAEGRIALAGRRVRVHGEPLAEALALRNPGAVG
jgi:phosphoribosylglycinamide formyltransferase 1